MSTIKGALMDPMCAAVEQHPMAVFLNNVGNNSVVCKMTTAKTAEAHKRPTDATKSKTTSKERKRERKTLRKKIKEEKR